MATLSGFTRPSDPINAADLLAQISTALGKTVDTLVITPTDIQVTGSTIVSGDQTSAQTAVTTYFYNYTQYGVPVSDNPDMSANNHGGGVTQHAAYMADTAVANLSNKVQTGSTVATGAWAILRKATTNSSGVATIYLTTDGTSGTAAAFETVYEDGIVCMPVGADNYQVTSCVLSGDKKSIAVTLNKIANLLGVLTFSTTAGAGVEVRAAVWGK